MFRRNKVVLLSTLIWYFCLFNLFILGMYNKPLNVCSRGKQFCFPSSLDVQFPRRSQGKHRDSRENKTIFEFLGSRHKVYKYNVLFTLIFSFSLVLNKDTAYIRDSSSPSSSRKCCLHDFIQYGGLMISDQEEG